MKIFFLFFSILTSTSTMVSPTNPLAFKNLDNYFIGNNVIFKNQKQTWVIKNSQDFDKVFHPAALNGQNVEAPDFDHEIVLGIGIRPSNNAYEIVIAKVERTKRLVRVWYSVELKEMNLSYTRTSLALVSISKENATQEINFYLTKQLSKAK